MVSTPSIRSGSCSAWWIAVTAPSDCPEAIVRSGGAHVLLEPVEQTRLVAHCVAELVVQSAPLEQRRRQRNPVVDKPSFGLGPVGQRMERQYTARKELAGKIAVA